MKIKVTIEVDELSTSMEAVADESFNDRASKMAYAIWGCIRMLESVDGFNPGCSWVASHLLSHDNDTRRFADSLQPFQRELLEAAKKYMAAEDV